MGTRGSRVACTCAVLALAGACANPASAQEAAVSGVSLTALPIFDDPAIADLPEVLTAAPPSGIADLIPDGSMRYIDNGNSTYDIQINVMNVGTADTVGSTTRASIAGRMYNVTLYHYYDATPDPANIVHAGQRGYLLVKGYPSDARLYPCQTASVQIDLDHALQYGDFSGNDTREVLFYETGATCEFRWTTPINAATTGIEPSSQDRDDRGTGYSLQTIVSSFANGRRDGSRCSSCHNIESSYPYNPPVPVGGISEQPVDPYAPVSDGQAWVGGSDPWIYKFLARPDDGYGAKTPYLKAVFRRWYLTGAKL